MDYVDKIFFKNTVIAAVKKWIAYISAYFYRELKANRFLKIILGNVGDWVEKSRDFILYFLFFVAENLLWVKFYCVLCIFRSFHGNKSKALLSEHNLYSTLENWKYKRLPSSEIYIYIWCLAFFFKRIALKMKIRPLSFYDIFLRVTRKKNISLIRVV